MSDKVISLADRKAKKETDVSADPQVEVSFEEIIKKNKEIAERQKKDREKANKGVIRSYRLKH